MLSFIRIVIVMVALHSNKHGLKQKLAPARGIAETGLTTLLVGRMWVGIRKAVDHFRQGLMGLTGRSLEDGGTESTVIYDIQRKILVSVLETILVIFWKRMWLYSSLVQKIGLRLN